MGRPRMEFDLDQVRELAAMQCTLEEIAAVLKCSRETIQDRKRTDPEFLQAIEEGKEGGKASLRRLQFKAAQKGSHTMLIWLGKQYLGQKDRSETEFKDVTPLVIAPDDSPA